MTYVRTHTGEKIVCGWDDCRKPGLDEHQVREPDGGGGNLIYIFCTERHKMFHVNSHRKLGYLPVGSKSLLV